jgi:hypothetical protein
MLIEWDLIRGGIAVERQGLCTAGRERSQICPDIGRLFYEQSQNANIAFILAPSYCGRCMTKQRMPQHQEVRIADRREREKIFNL